ncbi:MAG: DUF309 domain-containing protein [Bacillaceae bacterium]|nr:DUF309 domain-containing protein [Bacillaceae bacterium]
MYPEAYIHYLVHFHATRDYFECHEILEEYWKSLPPSKDHDIWVGLIQLAVSLYHQRRDNFAGAVKMMKGALNNLEPCGEKLKELGLNPDELIPALKTRLREQELKQPYYSMNLPIKDPELERQCLDLCERKGVKWGEPSRLSDTFLIHKHKLRDRSDVIAERRRQLQQKNRNRLQ